MHVVGQQPRVKGATQRHFFMGTTNLPRDFPAKITRSGTKNMVQILYQHSVAQNRGTRINSEIWAAKEFLKFVRPLGSPPYPRLLPRPAARAPPAACCPLLATRCPLHAARTCLARPVASTHATVATVARRSHSDARQVRTWRAAFFYGHHEPTQEHFGPESFLL